MDHPRAPARPRAPVPRTDRSAERKDARTGYAEAARRQHSRALRTPTAMSFPAELVEALSGEAAPTAADRLLVSERLTTLEAGCAIEDPAFSPLLDGEWEVVYSGGVSPGPVLSPTREIALLMYAGGFTPGNFLLSVRRVLSRPLLAPSLHPR